MKIFDLFHIALSFITRKRVVLPAMGFAIASFCLCFAGAVFTAVREEKAQPCELIINSPIGSQISYDKLAEVLQIENVEAVTAAVQVPVTLRTGEYELELSLTGMDGNYIRDAYVAGSAFPPESAMPYVVLNEAACKMFTEDNAKTSEETPQTDWLNASFTLSAGTAERDITAGVCGILSDGDKDNTESKAFISLPWAKELLRKSGQTTDVTTAWVRIKNIGSANSVAKELSALGLNAANTNDRQQEKWDALTREMTYLTAMGLFSLACAAFLMSVNARTTIAENENSFDMLRWIGMKEWQLSRMFLISSFVITLIGTAIGVVIALALPSFLPQDSTGVSNFALSVPFYVVLLSASLCIAAGMLSGAGKYR